MDAATFRSFARTAIELQADPETPPDYTMIKAAVSAKYGIQKQAASAEWLTKMVSSGAAKATDARLGKFIQNRTLGHAAARAGADTPHANHVMRSNWHAMRPAHEETLRRAPFQRSATKLAWNAGELAGLGILATPAAANLSGHSMKEKHKDVAEVTGLGMLAAPYAHNIAANRSARYAGSGIGTRLGRVFSH